MFIALFALIGLGAFLVFDDSGDEDDPESETDRTGTEENDILTGDAGDNLLRALAGDDLVMGEGGDDTLEGGSGQDVLFGGKQADSVSGGAGDDYLVGGKGEDTLDGGAGDDVLIGSDQIRDVELTAAIQAVTDLSDLDALLDSDSYVDLTRDLGEADLLLGGDGEDALVLGANDTGTSGAGEDLIVIGDWMNTDEGHAVVTDLRDLQTSGDLLVLEYDGTGPAPDLRIEHDDAEGVSYLFADERLVLEVVNAPGAPKLQLNEITLSAYFA